MLHELLLATVQYRFVSVIVSHVGRTSRKATILRRALVLWLTRRYLTSSFVEYLLLLHHLGLTALLDHTTIQLIVGWLLLMKAHRCLLRCLALIEVGVARVHG